MARRRIHRPVMDEDGNEIEYRGCQIHWERMSPEGAAAMEELIRAAKRYAEKLFAEPSEEAP